jgi:hypothetical protein
MYLVLGKQVMEAEIIALGWVCVVSILFRVEFSFHLDALFVCQRRSGTRSRKCCPRAECAGRR